VNQVTFVDSPLFTGITPHAIFVSLDGLLVHASSGVLMADTDDNRALAAIAASFDSDAELWSYSMPAAAPHGTYSTYVYAAAIVTSSLDPVFAIAVGVTGSRLEWDGSDLEETIVMTSPATQAAGYMTAYDGQGEVAEGITFTFEMVRGPGGEAQSFDGAEFSADSDSSGLVQVAFARGATYQGRREDGRYAEFLVPDDAMFALPEILGRPG
jgi:hypothetical protein